MTDLAGARDFLLSEVEALAPFEFVFLGPSENPLHSIEVGRREDGGLEVRVPGRPPVVPELPVRVRSALRERGFASEDASDRAKPWVRDVPDAKAAVDTAGALFTDVFGEKPDFALNIIHGSHQVEHEAQQKLEEVRQRVEAALTETMKEPPTQDLDGDYVLALGDVHVTVAPRIGPGGVVVVRVFAITNVGVTVGPELGLFLARLNFGLVFGRFALDAEHRSIWFDETLLGDHFTDDELAFVIRTVASTADNWDDRLKQMFGGVTYQEVLESRAGPGASPPPKPGAGGYL
jgi:hypothetical protein